MKKIILLSVIFLCACGDQVPAPQDAIKACIDKGWIPDHFSNGGQNRFTCTPPKQPK